MHISKLEFFAVVIAIFLGLHFYNQQMVESEQLEEMMEIPLYFDEENPPVIVAFGNSLTYGSGASREKSYPAWLSKMLGVEVINAGVPGETTSEGLKRLPSVLKRYRPTIVILSEGANDMLRGKRYSTIRENLRKMIESIKRSGAKVLLIGMPDINALLMDDAGFYEEVAQQTGVTYVEDLFADVLAEDTLKSDYLHPNGEGYKAVAKKLNQAIRELLE
ncbi:arylesterase [Hydrogenimonas cancrithermarum]|uniref:SGNH hydrolase-type esterase domain-containing protein n=1 Tax=Hydrogenimonas cancrithermarum TaxID=2993563 RepID=A0ABM8FI31_9BACT|nr:arylesterase [Hydrogenimonas cancrithermarum]BDY11944.1 hypothetical protein HCR_02560 [Hydrogenimonas cancrithermarum]